jgi:hypothetical protein
MPYGRDVLGKYVFRIREHHVADHLVPLIRARAIGAAKLDLVLRGVALPAAHSGKRQPGVVLPRHSWAQLNDLARDPRTLGSDPQELDPSSDVIRLKRKWVGTQLARLEEMQLVERIHEPGKRPRLRVLRDDGSGEPFDDPDGQGDDVYITILGSVISSATLAGWGAPELSAYLAATVAERHHPGAGDGLQPGGGRWYRPLRWFADNDRVFGPDARIRMSFSVPTLERGLATLVDEGLIIKQRILVDPRTRKRLQGPRNFYINNFRSLNSQPPAVVSESAADESAQDDE